MFLQRWESEARGSPAPWTAHLFKIRCAIQTVFPGFCNTRYERVMRSWAAWATAAAALLAQCPPSNTHCLGSCAQAFSLTRILTRMWGPAPWPQKKSVARGWQNFTRITGEWSKPALPHARCPMEGHTTPPQPIHVHHTCTPAYPRGTSSTSATLCGSRKVYGETERDFASFFYSGKQMLIIQMCKPILMLSP